MKTQHKFDGNVNFSSKQTKLFLISLNKRRIDLFQTLFLWKDNTSLVTHEKFFYFLHTFVGKINNPKKKQIFC